MSTPTCKNILENMRAGKSVGLYGSGERNGPHRARRKTHAMRGGGWLSTHEDVTEQRRAEEERAAIQRSRQAAAGRRYGNRRVPPAGGAAARGGVGRMRRRHAHDRDRVARLVRRRPARRAGKRGAGSFNDDLRQCRESAAVAAEELSRSIDEISRQLNHTGSIVSRRHRRKRAPDRRARSRVLAAGAQKIGDVVMLIHDIAGRPAARARRHHRGGARRRSRPRRRSGAGGGSRWRCRPPRRPRTSPARSPARRYRPPARSRRDPPYHRRMKEINQYHPP